MVICRYYPIQLIMMEFEEYDYLENVKSRDGGEHRKRDRGDRDGERDVERDRRNREKEPSQRSKSSSSRDREMSRDRVNRDRENRYSCSVAEMLVRDPFPDPAYAGALLHWVALLHLFCFYL